MSAFHLKNARPSSGWLPRVVLGAFAALTLFTAGCHLPRKLTDPITGPDYAPRNVHISGGWSNNILRRVAVLPATCNSDHSEMLAGRDLLEPILIEELGKTSKFEVVPVSARQLRQLTGRIAWSAEEKLPKDFFETLRNEFGCDLVLFIRVTDFRPYPPLAVGMNLKLMQSERLEVLWAVDEVIDATDPAVVNSARRYQRAQEQLPSSLSDSRSILLSPRSFGHFSARTLFGTIPDAGAKE